MSIRPRSRARSRLCPGWPSAPSSACRTPTSGKAWSPSSSPSRVPRSTSGGCRRRSRASSPSTSCPSASSSPTACPGTPWARCRRRTCASGTRTRSPPRPRDALRRVHDHAPGGGTGPAGPVRTTDGPEPLPHPTVPTGYRRTRQGGRDHATNDLAASPAPRDGEGREMPVFGVALLAVCTLVGVLVGDLLGVALGVKANVGGVGIAMMMLIAARIWLVRQGGLSHGVKLGVEFWATMYIPIVVAMAAQQNVVAAARGGPIVLIAGLGAVSICFACVALISRFGDKRELPPEEVAEIERGGYVIGGDTPPDYGGPAPGREPALAPHPVSPAKA